MMFMQLKNMAPLWACTATFLLAMALPVWALELPQPPDGYAWQEIGDLKGAVLVPSGWHFASEVSGNQYMYSIFRKDGEGEQPGPTRLTIMARRELSGKEHNKFVPSQFATAMFREIEKNQVIERTEAGPQGPFEMIRYQFVSSAATDNAIREYALLVANDQTGTLYVITFEAPLEQWEDSWQTVSVVLDTIFLDDEI